MTTKTKAALERTEAARLYPPRTVAVLNGGDSVIVVDDHCYAIRNFVFGEWRFSAWVFQEALDALKTLPPVPDDAVVTNQELGMTTDEIMKLADGYAVAAALDGAVSEETAGRETLRIAIEGLVADNEALKEKT